MPWHSINRAALYCLLFAARKQTLAVASTLIRNTGSSVLALHQLQSRWAPILSINSARCWYLKRLNLSLLPTNGTHPSKGPIPAAHGRVICDTPPPSFVTGCCFCHLYASPRSGWTAGVRNWARKSGRNPLTTRVDAALAPCGPTCEIACLSRHEERSFAACLHSNHFGATNTHTHTGHQMPPFGQALRDEAGWMAVVGVLFFSLLWPVVHAERVCARFEDF